MKKLLAFLLLLYLGAVYCVYYYRTLGQEKIDHEKEILLSVRYTNRFVVVLFGGEKYPIKE